MNVYTAPMNVRFRDLDAMGHVNNAEYLTYFAEARRFFLDSLTEDSAPVQFTFILARIQCDFLKPIHLMDRIVIDLWVKAIGKKSFHLAYRTRDAIDGRTLYAKGESVQVCYDYERQTPITVSEKLREKLRQFMA